MTNFVFCIHNHQPVGNFESVLEDAYKDSYWPFLKAVSKHPSIKLTIHNTGFLLDWLIKNRPEYIELLKSMVATGQAEIMGGGYYEPILQVLPERDRVGQVRMMSERIEKVFGVRPRGIWLAERIWEPTLPTTLKKAGIEYLLVDDYHFIKSGLKKEDLGGYYVTEDQGNVLKIFPGSEALRYLIPFQETDRLEAHLKGLKGFLRRGNSAIYGDDGEKFGVWPGTGKWVFEEGWLERFFGKIEECREWLRPATMSEVLDSEDPLGRVYLPTTSYMEMGEWSLPAEASKEYTGLIDRIGSWHEGETVKRFLQGGTWRNFFSKYPESNWLHKRMLMVSKAVEAGSSSDAAASDHLYRAQCNDAYWHGVFGGLYLPHLRTSAYKSLIEAENAMGGAEFRPASTVVRSADLDADGFEEVLLRTRDLNLFISPRNGGSVFEMDFKPVPVNLSNTLTRWFEGYHHKLEYIGSDAHHGAAKSIHDMVKVKEAGLEKYLKYDKARRVSFVERFISGSETLEAFYSNAYKDLGDFGPGAYGCETIEGGVRLERKGRLGGGTATVTKEITAAESSFTVEYLIKDLNKAAIASDMTGRFCVELNILMPCCDGPACQYRFTPEFDGEPIGLGSTGELKGVRSVAIADTYTGVIMTIEADRPVTLWRFPVHTVSLSEGGFEKIYQGSCLAFMYPMSFEDGFEMKAGLKVRIESI